MQEVKVTHFSDILCVWAYVCQIRVDELLKHFGDKVEVEYRLFPVFPDTSKKLQAWQSKGGVQGYNQHVCGIFEQFPHVKVHPDVWIAQRPASSLPSHLFLSAVRMLEQRQELSPDSFHCMSERIRQAFFAEVQNVADLNVLYALAEQENLPATAIEKLINNGEAFAEMTVDMRQAQQLHIRSSPTLLFNEDRQRLAGNVGYRIIEANIRELLENPNDQQSWC